MPAREMARQLSRGETLIISPMLFWFKKKPGTGSSLPELADWERTCPDCDTADGQLHEQFCLKECCPFCRGQLVGCSCIKQVLRLTTAESQVVDEYVDDTLEPLRTLMKKWSEALEHKGRIPYSARPLPLSADGLILAAARGALPFVRALQEKGVAVDAANEVGYTPLMAAARSYRVDVVLYLLNRKADARLCNKYGHSALHCAVMTPTSGLKEAMSMQADCVRSLLRHNAEVDPIDQSGGTPLMHAAWFGCTTSVEVLLQAGADGRKKDERGRSAQQLAHERGHAAIASLLGKNFPNP
jgi:hypothetical protein